LGLNGSDKCVMNLSDHACLVYHGIFWFISVYLGLFLIFIFHAQVGFPARSQQAEKHRQLGLERGFPILVTDCDVHLLVAIVSLRIIDGAGLTAT
jgi:hypothetical protein